MARTNCSFSVDFLTYAQENHGSCLAVSIGFALLLILLLPERKFLNIIPAVAGMPAATFISLG